MTHDQSDATDTAQAQLALMEDAFDSFRDGVALIDVNGIFVASNARYREMFFDEGKHPRPGDTAINVVRLIVEGGRVFGLDQMDPDHAVLLLIIDCYSFVQDAEFALTDGRVIQVSSTPTKKGGALMTFRDTERDRIGERRAAELMSDGFGSADVGMVFWDAALAVQLFNSAWPDLTLPLQIGDDVGDLVARFVSDGLLVVPQGVSNETFVQDLVSEMHRGATRFLLDLPDGRRVQVSTFGIASGGVMATAVDVSIQRDAEERAKALLTDAVEALEIGVVHFDSDLNLLLMNGVAAQTLMPEGKPPEIGTAFVQIIEDLINAGAILLAEDQTADELIAEFERNVRNYATGSRPNWKDNRTLEFSASSTMMGGYLISVQDLTDAVNADRAAKEANELVRTIVDASPTTFLVSKVKTGEVVFATNASRERFGNISSTLSFFLDPEHRKTYLEALLPSGSLTDYPVRFRRQDGSVMDGLTSARVITYQGEEMIVSSTRDITDFLALQRELEVQRRQALQNEKLSALGELLAGVAHELSNPLSVIVGYAMMLQDEDVDPTFAQKLDRIAIAANRCVRIVKMFLALARERPTVLESCDIAELVETAVSISDTDLITAGCRLEVDIAENLPIATADADQVTQVLSNLIVNAGHAVKDKGQAGKVSVRAFKAQAEDMIAIEVEDNGPGIPSELEHRVFEPFFTTKDVGQGTGIGLAFSHRVITAHGGRLALDSPEQGGALLRVLLPIDQKDVSEQNDFLTALEPGTLAGRVLVSGHQPDVSKLLEDVLRRAGYDVALCASGYEALARCEDQAFDAVLCDMRMPDMTGEAFFEALKQSRPDLSKLVVFLTGDAMNTDVAAFLEHSGQPHLEKPLTPNEILTQLADITKEIRK